MDKKSVVIILLFTLMLTIGVVLVRRSDSANPKMQITTAETVLEEIQPPVEEYAATLQATEHLGSDAPTQLHPLAYNREEVEPYNLASLSEGAIAALDDRKGNPRTEYQRRNEALRNLGTSMSRNDIEAFYQFLHSSPEECKALGDLALNSLKNNVLDLLLRQDELQPDLGRELLGIFYDETQDDVMRDYSLQHFESYLKRAWAQISPEEKEEFIEAYYSAMDQVDKSFPGTALIGLSLLSKENSEVDSGRIIQSALSMAENPSLHSKSRVTAMQICGLHKEPRILPLARIESQSAETVHLRMSAIATLGDIGSEPDIELLQSFASEKDKRIHTAAQSSLRRLGKRLGESVE